MESVVDNHLVISEIDTVFIKGAIGASGSSLYIINPENKKEMITKVTNNLKGLIIIECGYDIINSPNSLWFIGNNSEPIHLGTSNQIFASNENNNFVQNGNVTSNIPFYEKVIKMGKIIGKTMAQKGFRNILGIDFIITKKGRIMPIDNNPRINGSLYGWEILKELQRRHSHLKEARFINITTRPLTFNKLIGRIGDLLYTGSVGEATIFPLNPGLIPYGKVSMAICGADGDTIKDVEEELKKIFSTNKNS